MKHKPFEAWLLSWEQLSPTQEADLAAHLEGCSHCRALRDGLREAEVILRDASMVRPAPGFRSRWVAVQAQDAVRRRQAAGWRLLATTMLSLTVGLVLLGLIFVLTGGSLSVLFAGYLQEAVRWVLWGRAFGEMGQTLVRNLPLLSVSAAVIFLTVLTAATGVVALTWSLSIRQFSLRGARK